MIWRAPCAAARASARSCVRNTSGRAKRQPQSADPQERIALAFDGEPRDRLVAACIERADDHGPALRPLDEAAVGAILVLLAWQRAAIVEQELGAHQADAIADRRVERAELVGMRDVEADADARAVARDGRAVCERRRGGAQRGLPLRFFVEIALRLRLGSRISTPLEASTSASPREFLELHVEADQSGDAARARQHGDVTGGAAASEHQRAAA